ncbi:MAG: hypothetical protein IJR68_12655 [Fretibacterium sp.]|nr:hypothetical protein [Fretibacterium sp.]
MSANSYDVLSVEAYGCNAESFMARDRNKNFFGLENEQGIYLRILARRREAFGSRQ